MKILNFKFRTMVWAVVLIFMSGVFVWHGEEMEDSSYLSKIGQSIFGNAINTATATTFSLNSPTSKKSNFFSKYKKQNKKNIISKKTGDFSKEIPFGFSNPYDQKDLTVKSMLPSVLKDLGLSDGGDGVAGFVVDEIARKHTEKTCDDRGCQYDFSLAKDLIDLVVGQGKTNLWVVIGLPSYHQFIDGRQIENERTYLPDGPISRQAYRDYLEKMVSFVNTYGKQVSGNKDWFVPLWNLYNEVGPEYRRSFSGDVDKATEAYANFVIDSAEILRRLSPQSKIVLAGASSADLQKRGLTDVFYKQVLLKLKQANLSYEPFDYWESHWFGGIDNYKINEKGYGAKDFIKFLRDNGYGDKGFVIRAGGTYSGQDNQERKGFMANYQSEKDQAVFLVKRFVYNIANGAKKIPWSTIYERDKYQGERHVHFQYISLIYDGYPDGVSKNQKCVEGWLPCPDPGFDVKKLSYYAYKKLVEVLKGSDWSNIQTVQEANGIYIYKLNKENKNIWVVWSDSETNSQVSISGIKSSQIKITEAIPKYESGKDVIDYNTVFNSEIKIVNRNNAIITLNDMPIFVEEI